jgi:DNA-binding CsgD family transcriptional regulator
MSATTSAYAGGRVEAEARSHAALIALVNAIGRPVAVFDADGSVVLRSKALTALLATEPGRDAIMDAARVAAVAHLNHFRTDIAVPHWIQGPAAMVRPHRRGYSILPLLVPRGTFTPSPSAAVVIERVAQVAHGQPSVAASYFGLTPRESHVLQLLLARYTTSEMAHTLGVSAHTVRHHIERIYRKTHVRKRGELHALLDADPTG